MKDKNGFTLVELLAVIVILAIIGVIVRINVSDVLEKATESSFKSSYDIIHKDVENRVKQIELGLDVDLECDDNSDDNNKHCSKIYELSEEDYKMKVAKVNDSYSLCVEGIGKFEDLDLDKNKYKAIYTIFGNASYNKINVKNTEYCNSLNYVEGTKPEEFTPNNNIEIVEYIGRKTASYLHENVTEMAANLEETSANRTKVCQDAVIEKYKDFEYHFGRNQELRECESENKITDYYFSKIINEDLEKNFPYGQIMSTEMNEDRSTITINLVILEDASSRIDDCKVGNGYYKGCSDIIDRFQYKDLFCYFMGSTSGDLFAEIVIKKDENGKYVYVKENNEKCLGRN